MNISDRINATTLDCILLIGSWVLLVGRRMEFPTKSTEEVLLQKYYAELVRSLTRCIDDVVLGLVSHGVIDIDQKNVIRQYGDTPGDKVQYLLDNYIVRPLYGGVTDGFVKLLSVMKEYPDCGHLVASMEEEYKGGITKEDGVSPRVSPSEQEPLGEDKLLDEITKLHDTLDEKIEHLQGKIDELHEQGMLYEITGFRHACCPSHL